VGAGALGALLALIFPVFHGASLARVYTPVPAAEKRAGKTLIDVGCDRAGDVLGSAIVQFMLWSGVSFIPSGLSWLGGK